MVVAARGIALSRMLYLLAGLIFAGNLFAALAFDYWSMLAARFIAGLPHGAYFGVGAIVARHLRRRGLCGAPPHSGAQALDAPCARPAQQGLQGPVPLSRTPDALARARRHRPRQRRLFACYSYVNPIMETVASVPTSLMSAVIALAGFGMVAGNLLSARLAGRFSDQALAWWIHLERKR